MIVITRMDDGWLGRAPNNAPGKRGAMAKTAPLAAALTPGLLLLIAMTPLACGDSSEDPHDAATPDAAEGRPDAGDSTPDGGDVSIDAGDGPPDGGTKPSLDLASHVDPFIGTDDSDSPHPVPGGAGGSTYPGAVVPFGMVQLGPDTPTASPSGYRFSDTQIEDFSMTHFN